MTYSSFPAAISVPVLRLARISCFIELDRSTAFSDESTQYDYSVFRSFVQQVHHSHHLGPL